MDNFACEAMTCEYRGPDPDAPYWHIVLRDIRAPVDGVLRYVYVDGQQSRHMEVRVRGRARYRRELSTGESFDVTLRCHWHRNTAYRVRLVLTQGRNQTTADTEVMLPVSPAAHDYWDPAWSFVEALVLRERIGVARSNEPVHVGLGLYRRTVPFPDGRDFRLMRVDPHTAELAEVPVQVLEWHEWDDPKLVSAEPYRYQPSYFAQIVFLADVPAHGEVVYLLFHGNPAAERRVWDSDLLLRDAGDKHVVANSFYEVDLHHPSGMIDAIRFRHNGAELTHKLEREGTIHWNPCVYPPPRPWVHTNDWQQPSHSFSPCGPVCLAVTTWGPMPEGVDEVKVRVTYYFYAHSPCIRVDTHMAIEQDIAVQSLRNAELVFNRQHVTHFAWQDHDGAIQVVDLNGARPHPEHGAILPPDARWLAFDCQGRACGVGQIFVSNTGDRSGAGVPLAETPYMYLAVGPWVYAARTITYAYGSETPNRMVVVPAGSAYHEEFLLELYSEEGQQTGFRQVVEQAEKSRSALFVHAVYQRLEETPGRFVGPLLRFPIDQVPSDEVLDPTCWQQEEDAT